MDSTIIPQQRGYERRAPTNLGDEVNILKPVHLHYSRAGDSGALLVMTVGRDPGTTAATAAPVPHQLPFFLRFSASAVSNAQSSARCRGTPPPS